MAVEQLQVVLQRPQDLLDIRILQEQHLHLWDLLVQVVVTVLAVLVHAVVDVQIAVFQTVMLRVEIIAQVPVKWYV